MDPRDWSRIQQGIFAGESGGDYGALFGYQNRPNGRFSGVDLTKMTVDQALDFANPSGPYGQYVKGQVGRVATPMGAYQIVGTTLRAAKEGLGLRGDEVLTPAMQDKLGQWIYKTQGTGAWEGYKPMTEGQAIAAETMSLLGKGPQTSTKGPQMMQEQKPQGLLGSLGIQKMEEGAEGETGQRFYNRDSFKDTAAVLAQGFGRMGIMGMEEIADGIAKQRTEAKAKNKTMEALSKLPNGEHLMRVAEIAGPKAAVSLYVDQQRGGGASGVQSSSMLRDQSGVLLTMRDGSIQVKTAGGETLSGQAAMDFVAKSNEAAAEYAATIAGAKVTGANLAEAETGGAAAAATAGGAAAGKIQGDARARLAGQRAVAENTISLIDDLLVDPALARSTGPIQGLLPNISGGARRVQTKLDQLQGKAFLEAYNILKGGGQITEVEGQKAESAMVRLKTAQTDADFVDALNDFKDAVRLGILKLEADAGVGGASALPANNAAAADDPLGLRGAKP